MKACLWLFVIAFAAALLSIDIGSARAQSNPPSSSIDDAALTQSNLAEAGAEAGASTGKRVWTNDDLKDLRDQPDVPTFEKSSTKSTALRDQLKEGR
jgi:hypothetical protein